MNENTNLTPRKIVEYLDQYIIGQTDAKRSVAVALRNRWRASRLTPEMAKEVSPKNILLIGPTGVGKTEIARRIATLTRAPFVKVEATKYTEVGYVGRDVESMIRDLAEEAVRLVKKEESARHGKDADEEAIHRIAEAMWPSKKAETRSPMDIIFGEAKKETPMDEGEKERRKDLETRIRNGDLDDRVIEIEVEEKGNPGNTDNEQANQISMMLSSMMPKKMKKKKVTVRDAKRILAEAAADEMVDMEVVKDKAIHYAEERGIIFIDEIDKIAGGRSSGGPDVSREGVQRDILATKWPIYDAKGNIAGLMGYFVSAETLARVQQQSHKAAFVDAVTGLANVKGLLFLLAQYLDEYRFSHRNFVVIFIKIRAIDRLLRRYGAEACDEVLCCIAEEIRRVLGPVGASGRFERNQFLVFSQYNSQEEVRDLGQRLRTGIESIHNFGQRSCTLFVETHMAYPQDQSDFYEDIITALLGRSRRK